jgi:serine/threonine protein kinase
MPLLNGYVEGTVHPDRFIETMTPTAAQPPDTFALLQSILHALAPSDIKATRFCHMDIHPGNIMVRNGRLSGIIDWEMSGWYNWQIESYAASHVVFYDPSYGPVLTAAWDTEPTLITSGSFDRMLLEGGFTQWRISARTAKRSRSTDVRQHRQDKQKVKRKSSTRKPQGGLGLDLSSLDI